MLVGYILSFPPELCRLAEILSIKLRATLRLRYRDAVWLKTLVRTSRSKVVLGTVLSAPMVDYKLTDFLNEDHLTYRTSSLNRSFSISTVLTMIYALFALRSTSTFQ